MKRLFTLLVSIAIIAFLTSSCTSSRSISAKTMDITKTGIYQNTVIVDLKVSEKKVSGTATGSATARAQINAEAVASALKTSGADVLVEPLYNTVTSGSKITVTVTGFPATYYNFRALKTKDLELIKAAKAINVSTSLNTVK